MNKFANFFTKVGVEALEDVPPIIGEVYPPLSGLMGVISSLVLKSQVVNGPGNNDVKKSQVTEEFAMFQPFIIPLIERITGRDLDDEAIGKLISDAIDINVQWHKIMGNIPTPNVAPALVSTVPVANPAPVYQMTANPEPIRQTIPIAGQ